MPKSLGNIYSQDVPTGRPGTSLYDVLQSFSKCSNWINRPLVGLNDQWWCIITISSIYCWCWRSRSRSSKKVPCILLHPGKYFAIILYWLTSTNLQKITLNNTQKGCLLSPRCRITQKSDRQVLRKFQGRPYKTSCNIFWNNFKQIDIQKSPKNIEL